MRRNYLLLEAHKIAKKGYNLEQVHNLTELKGKRNVKVEDIISRPFIDSDTRLIRQSRGD